VEDTLLQFIHDHNLWTYPIILAWTFIEGETIVILCAAAAHDMGIPIEMLALTAFLGSFLGDQTYYFIGQKYGAPLLSRWPKLEHKIEWAFKLVKDHPVWFILSFRFIYGVRNFAPFVIGISSVPRVKFLVLNFIAAQVWAHSFAWGGYYLGKTMDHYLGTYKWMVLAGFVAFILLIVMINYLHQKRQKNRRPVSPIGTKLEVSQQSMTTPDAAA
jgi:membrane protein DedA with SNARE-associated domain